MCARDREFSGTLRGAAPAARWFANWRDAQLRLSASKSGIRADCVAVAMMSPFLSLLAITWHTPLIFNAARRTIDPAPVLLAK